MVHAQHGGIAHTTSCVTGRLGMCACMQPTRGCMHVTPVASAICKLFVFRCVVVCVSQVPIYSPLQLAEPFPQPPTPPSLKTPPPPALARITMAETLTPEQQACALHQYLTQAHADGHQLGYCYVTWSTWSHHMESVLSSMAAAWPDVCLIMPKTLFPAGGLRLLAPLPRDIRVQFTGQGSRTTVDPKEQWVLGVHQLLSLARHVGTGLYVEVCNAQLVFDLRDSYEVSIHGPLATTVETCTCAKAWPAVTQTCPPRGEL